jgi:3-phenylpropionate/trans-cinnamate dioxygenase ferredoxin subunit
MAVAVCAEGEIPVGTHREFDVNGTTVLVYHLDDGFYATQNRCTHLFMSLKKGKIVDGCRVQCPFHRAQFDIRTGEVHCWANFPPGVQLLNVVRGEKALQTFPVNVVDGMVYVEVG